MVSRPVDETPRASTPLELLFDLTFVVAVAAVAAELAHGIADGHALELHTGYQRFFQGAERINATGMRLVDVHALQ